MVIVIPYHNTNESEKLRPQVVEEFKRPLCLKNVKHYPCEYKANENAWITGRIFQECQLYLETEQKLCCYLTSLNTLNFIFTCHYYQFHEDTTLRNRLLHKMCI